jgi:AraC-like DNA-binding protein
MVDYYLVIGAVVVYVESRLQSGIRCDDLAKAVGVSLPHLRAVFDRYTGQPLAHYVMSRKIARAAFDAVHSSDTFLEIAGRYGFTNPDTFTRAFRRVTGSAPQEFRKRKAQVGRAILCAGVYGVSVTNHQNILKEMNNMDTNEQKRVSEGSVILYGVPKVRYGAFGGCTPFPICLKAVANYMGMELDYEDAVVLCGAAFRLVWDTTAWNAGNVDVIFTFDDPAMVYRSGIEALGREFRLLGRDGSAVGKDAFIAFIRERIDKGIPVIALGIIGPPEACVITGYRDNGQTLLGWNCFQDSPEFASGVKIDESGYFETSSWWENRDTTAVMSLGEETGGPQALKAIIERAILALEPKQHGKYAKGIAAYDAWKKAILDESQFGENMVIPLQVERLMCQGDAMDCLSDGRNSAYKYFRKLAELHPEQALYWRITEQFAACASGARKMYETLGGWERGATQMKALMKSETRRKLGELIDDCKAADERTLTLLKELALKLN